MAKIYYGNDVIRPLFCMLCKFSRGQGNSLRKVDGVKSFYGIPIGVFDTIVGMWREVLFLLGFSQLVISSTFGDILKISPFCNTRSDKFLLQNL